jgi:hypothetical protein
MARTVAKALRTYVRTCSLFRIGRFSTNIILKFYKALITPVTTYACPTMEYAADAHLVKLQSLENRVLRAIGNLDMCTPDRELHVAFKFVTCNTILLNYAGHSRRNPKPFKSKCT